MFGKSRNTTNELREKIKQLMKRDTSEITTHSIEKRDLLNFRGKIKGYFRGQIDG